MITIDETKALAEKCGATAADAEREYTKAGKANPHNRERKMRTLFSESMGELYAGRYGLTVGKASEIYATAEKKEEGSGTTLLSRLSHKDTITALSRSYEVSSVKKDLFTLNTAVLLLQKKPESFDAIVAAINALKKEPRKIYGGETTEWVSDKITGVARLISEALPEAVSERTQQPHPARTNVTLVRLYFELAKQWDLPNTGKERKILAAMPDTDQQTLITGLQGLEGMTAPARAAFIESLKRQLVVAATDAVALISPPPSAARVIPELQRFLPVRRLIPQ